MTEPLFWLLFLFTEPGLFNSRTSLEGPLGAYTVKIACEREGKKLEESLGRRYSCRPADELALRYMRGDCLGDAKDAVAVVYNVCNKGSGGRGVPPAIYEILEKIEHLERKTGR